MPLPLWLINVLGKITGEAIQKGVGTVKDATEIPKNIAETEKIKLEIQNLKDDRAKRESPIQIASDEEIKRYDTKFHSLKRAIQEQKEELGDRFQTPYAFVIAPVLIFVVIAMAFPSTHLLDPIQQFIDKIFKFLSGSK